MHYIYKILQVIDDVHYFDFIDLTNVQNANAKKIHVQAEGLRTKGSLRLH